LQETLGPDGIPGYDKVQQLAAFLVDLGNNQLYLTNNQAEDLVNLWTSLDEYDKRPIIFTEAYRKESKGRFRAKRQAAPGVESTERYVFI
jgi:ribosomal protein L19E